MKRILIAILCTGIYSGTFGQGSREHTTLVNVSEKTTIEEIKAKPKPCVPKNAFGLDLGIGGALDKVYTNSEVTGQSFDLGFRYVHHFLPYFGIDFFKLNNKFSILSSETEENAEHQCFSYNFQFMIGARGNSPAFYKCMSGYAAFRMGYGINYQNNTKTNYKEVEYVDTNTWDYYTVLEKDGETEIQMSGSGLCYELELGLNLTRNLFLAYVYNHQGGKMTPTDPIMDANSRYDYSASMATHSLRIGFNFGK